MRLGATLGFNPALGGYDPDALAYFAALATPPSIGFKIVVSTLISAFKAASVWSSSWDSFYILASEADGVNNYGINLINPATYAFGANTGSVTWTQYEGTTGDGSSTRHNIPGAMNAYTQLVEDSCSLFCWLNGLTSVAQGLMGDSDTRFALDKHIGSTIWQCRLSTTTNQSANNSTPYNTVPHSFLASRTGATTTNHYYDGVSDETTNAQTSDFPPSTGTMCIHQAAGLFGDGKIGFAGVGRGFNATEALAIHNAVAAANTSLAAL